MPWPVPRSCLQKSAEKHSATYHPRLFSSATCKQNSKDNSCIYPNPQRQSETACQQNNPPHFHTYIRANQPSFQPPQHTLIRPTNRHSSNLHTMTTEAT